MKFRMLLAALLLAPVLAFAENAAAAPDSPSGVMRRIFESAFRNMDFETAVPLSHGEAQKHFRTSAEIVAEMRKGAESGDAVLKEQWIRIRAKYAEVAYEIKDEKIDGDQAVVTVIRRSGGSTESIRCYLVRIDGGWKYVKSERVGK